MATQADFAALDEDAEIYHEPHGVLDSQDRPEDHQAQFTSPSLQASERRDAREIQPHYPQDDEIDSPRPEPDVAAGNAGFESPPRLDSDAFEANMLERLGVLQPLSSGIQHVVEHPIEQPLHHDNGPVGTNVAYDVEVSDEEGAAMRIDDFPTRDITQNSCEHEVQGSTFLAVVLRGVS